MVVAWAAFVQVAAATANQHGASAVKVLRLWTYQEGQEDAPILTEFYGKYDLALLVSEKPEDMHNLLKKNVDALIGMLRNAGPGEGKRFHVRVSVKKLKEVRGF
jgi:hypothetical protein